MVISKNLRLVISKKSDCNFEFYFEKVKFKNVLRTIITKLSNHKNGTLYQVTNKMAKFDWLSRLVVLIGC